MASWPTNLWVFLLIIQLSGCFPLSIDKMHAVFRESVEDTVGKTMSELTDPGPSSFIGRREPTSIVKKSDGKVVYTYQDYFGQYGLIRDGICDIILEFDAGSMRVTNAGFEGHGCYTSY
jgi:hypothetical protein